MTAAGDPIETALSSGKRVISVPEAGAYLGLGKSQAYAAARAGRIPGTVQVSARSFAVLIGPFRRFLDEGAQ